MPEPAAAIDAASERGIDDDSHDDDDAGPAPDTEEEEDAGEVGMSRPLLKVGNMTWVRGDDVVEALMERTPSCGTCIGMPAGAPGYAWA